MEAADVGPEEDGGVEPDIEDVTAMPDLLAKDTELEDFRSILGRESEADEKVTTHYRLPGAGAAALEYTARTDQ